MRRPYHEPIKLPRRILEELGASVPDYNGKRRHEAVPGTRKEQRKTARVEKRTRHVPNQRTTVKERFGGSSNTDNFLPPTVAPQNTVTTASAQSRSPRSILKPSRASLGPAAEEENTSSRPSSPESTLAISKQVKSQLAQDNAEIEVLERALGFNKKKTLPKSFEDDGLDLLLDGLDSIESLDQRSLGKRKRKEEQVWLEQKRQRNNITENRPKVFREESEIEFAGFGSEEEEAFIEDRNEDIDKDTISSSLHSLSGSREPDVLQLHGGKPVRENPYIAPSTGSFEKTAKYLPPSLRDSKDTPSEELFHLRRQLQGLLNRLSEANILSVVREVDTLFRTHARQLVSSTLTDILMALLSDPAHLQETFIILHAGFITAFYRILGPEFGAQVISRIDEEFVRYHQKKRDPGDSGKRTSNLISLLAELYTFQVIGSGLVYDYARLCLNDLSETNTELLLRIIRIAGHQLRKDDPSSLKAMVTQLNEVVTELGESALPVRTRFMIEIINNLKNNKMKTGVAAASIASEHTISMKKTLGTLNHHNVRVTEPLRIGLVDIRESEKRGKWWIIDASYGDHDRQDTRFTRRLQGSHDNDMAKTAFAIDDTGDLAQLAKEQRMNTDVRRSIFVAIMSATDYSDAYIRLMKLRLKKSQQLEVPKVLIQCAGAEEVYNPFYTLLSRRICSERKLKMAFQFALWDLFKSMGENSHGDDDDNGSYDEDDATKSKFDLRTRANLSRMFGTLIADGGLSLGVLKNLNLAYLRPKTRMFVEILLITLILQTQISGGEKRNEATLVDIFLRPKEMIDMASSLRYFLKKVVSKGDIAGSSQDRETVRWGCKVASDALSALQSHSRTSS